MPRKITICFSLTVWIAGCGNLPEQKSSPDRQSAPGSRTEAMEESAIVSKETGNDLSLDTSTVDVPISFCGKEYPVNANEIECQNFKQLDLSNLARFTKLSSLNLEGSTIKKFKSSFFPKSIRELYLDRTNISDLIHIRELKSLELLTFYGTPVEDLSPLTEFHSLKLLKTNSCPIPEPNPLTSLSNLELLSLSDPKLSDIGFVRNFTNLQTLVLRYTSVLDLDPLIELSQFKKLVVYRWRRGYVKYDEEFTKKLFEQFSGLRKKRPDVTIEIP